MDLVVIALLIWSAIAGTASLAFVVTREIRDRRAARRDPVDSGWLKSLGLPKLAPWQRDVLRDLARRGVSPTGRKTTNYTTQSRRRSILGGDTVSEPDQWHPDVPPSPNKRVPKHANTDAQPTDLLPRVSGRPKIETTGFMPTAGLLAADIMAEYNAQPVTPRSTPAGSRPRDMAPTEVFQEVEPVTAHAEPFLSSELLADLAGPPHVIPADGWVPAHRKDES